MIEHIVRVHPSKARLPRQRQLAWAIASFATGDMPIDREAADPAGVRGRIEIRLEDGGVITAEKAVANAHPNGLSPWDWPDYVEKFDTPTSGAVDPQVRDRFIDSTRRLPRLGNAELVELTPTMASGSVEPLRPTREGIFDHR